MKKIFLSILAICFVYVGYAQVNPIQMGRSSNAFTCLRTEQNQLAASDDLNSVVFVHRQDVTVWGGGGSASGQLRYDISTNGGTTFSNDIGSINPQYSLTTRYPQAVMYNPTNNTNLANARVNWTAPTIQANWLGIGSGTANANTMNPPTVRCENYQFTTQPNNTLLPGGLCEGLPGEFWQCEFANNGTSNLDTIHVYKGTWNANTNCINWARSQSIFLNNYKGFDGNSRLVGPNMSFSPNGQTGWIGFLGDLVGGHDSTYSPILIRSTNGGASWGVPQEVDLRTIPWVDDSLQTLWVDQNGNPASTGRPTTGFDFDITVDANGNPHLLTMVGSATTTTSLVPGYTIFTGVAKFMIDVTSTNGGASFTGLYVAPVLAFRGDFGVPDQNGNLLTMDNFPQVSRTEDGQKVFYSWVDSDTTITGFGESNNLAPNLRISGLRISDGFRTCYKRVTDGDFIWDGRALFPSMAPTVLSGVGTYKLPISMLDMITNDQLQPCQFWYFGNDATFTDNDFVNPNTLDLSWGGACFSNCANPVANYNYGPGFGGPLSIDFTDVSTNSPTTWSWSFGDGGTSTQQNPQYVYSQSGTYTVCLTVTNACSTSTTCQQVTVCASPVAGFSSNVNGNSVTFSDQTVNSPTTWSWTFGDGGTSTLQNPTHSYNNPGTYTVCLSVTNGCGSNTTCNTVTVSCIGPAAAFNSSTNGNTVTFSDISSNTPTQWLWDFGNGNLSTMQNPTHTYAQAGTYTVCLTVTNNCGSDSSCQTITLGCQTPSSAFSQTVNGNTATLSDQSTGSPTSWSWAFGDGNTSTQQNPVHTYASSGNYTVCLTTSNACGPNTNCQTVTVTCANPVVTIGTLVNGNSVTFTDQSSGSPTSWSWTFGDGGTSTQQSPNHVYANPGTYTACLTATNACGSGTSCTTVTVTCAGPSASFTNSINGLTVAFTDNSTGNPSSFQWDFGDGNGSSSQNPSHTYTAGGVYTVCLYATNNCSTDTTCQTITVTCANPVTSFGTTINGASVTFVDQSTGSPTSWSWTFGDGGTSTMQSPNHVYSNPGTYTVCLTATNACGSNTSCNPVTISCAFPAAAFNASVANLTVSLTDQSTGTPTSYLWDFGDGNFSTQQNPTYTYGQEGTYTVCLIVNNGCGADTSCQTLNVCALPASGFTFSNTGGSTTVMFSDGSTDATSWTWDFGDGNFSTSQNPSYTYASLGNYTVCLIASNTCGSDTSCQQITLAVGLNDAGPLDAISAFPNPTAGEVVLEMELSDPAALSVRITDLRGKVLVERQLAGLGGMQQERFDLSEIASGIYLMEVEAEGQKLVRKIVRE